MASELTSLNTRLEHVLGTLKSEAGALPDPELRRLANQSIDLLHQIEQMLEPGYLVLADHFLGYVHAKCLVAAVDFSIADTLEKSGPMTIDSLAKACSARGDRLAQVLRVFISNGVFALDETTKKYTNNSTSKLLLTNHWTQWHRWATLYGNQFYDMARGIPSSLQKDAIRSAAQINYDTDLNMFEYFRAREWVPQLHATLGAGAAAQAPGILADYPWSDLAGETIIDIGGGGGGFMAMLLRAHQSFKGGIFDLPHVIEYAKPMFHSPDGQFADVAAQIPVDNLIGGDFFEKKAIVPGDQSKLIILEEMLDTTRSARLSRYGDMNMMIAANGVERTRDEWMALADRAGWVITNIYPLRNAWHCAFDLVPKIYNSSTNNSYTTPYSQQQITSFLYYQSLFIATPKKSSIVYSTVARFAKKCQR
ncbi:S-adenosyl-L-methionine-dependent methyltransferase [Periconia macrospinosa]|uniref:S-adenosyl-L-methionine-dependent methyltransferase n=1 Tax=Periconia macrospinosa TaxID=97972 RepID=A0A2V1DHZ4_9PLEO|nr:S-adenosyl-L-methionine-dependent methyltransferase [Periconia macrospinosa]